MKKLKMATNIPPKDADDSLGCSEELEELDLRFDFILFSRVQVQVNEDRRIRMMINVFLLELSISIRY